MTQLGRGGGNVSAAKHSLELERAVAAALVVDKNAVVRVVDVVSPSDFMSPEIRAVVSAVYSLFSKGKVVDMLTVNEELRTSASAKDLGVNWDVYLTELTGTMMFRMNDQHLESYAREVRVKSVARGAENLMVTSAMKLQRDDADVYRVIDEHQGGILQLVTNMQRTKALPIEESVSRAVSIVDRIRSGEDVHLGAKTSIEKLDEHCAGIQYSALTIIAARPSMGKTSLMNKMALHIAGSEGVQLFSAEMSEQQLTLRMLSAEAQVEYMRIATAKSMRHDEVDRVKAVGRTLSALSLHIDDGASPTITDLRAKIRRAIIEHGTRVFFIDHLGLVRLSNKRARSEELGAVTEELKAIGKENNVAIAALHQLNRALEQRDDKRPILADLRDSGNIEEHADVVVFIYRPEYYGITQMPDDESDSAGKAHIIVAKNRNGAVGGFNVGFERRFTRFYNLNGPEAYGAPSPLAVSDGASIQRQLPVGDIDEGPAGTAEPAGGYQQSDPFAA